MIVELPEDLEAALKVQANAQGMSPEVYVRKLLEQDLALAPVMETKPYRSRRGALAKYGQAPSAEEMDANRAEMFRNYGESL